MRGAVALRTDGSTPLQASSIETALAEASGGDRGAATISLRVCGLMYARFRPSLDCNTLPFTTNVVSRITTTRIVPAATRHTLDTSLSALASVLALTPRA